jgi:Metallo-beta-lactamase superfamily
MAFAIHGARELSVAINAWESRWPINTYRARDATKVSKAMLERGVQAEAMTLNDYRRSLKERDKRRATFHKLAAEFDACITLTAPGAAPVGLGWTGDPIFVVPGSMAYRGGVRQVVLEMVFDASLPRSWKCLASASYAPGDVDMILFTHFHFDHLWGISDGKNASLLFPSAEFVASETEVAFWSDPELPGKVSAKQQPVVTQTNLKLASPRLRQIKAGADVAPGVSTFDTAGHS